MSTNVTLLLKGLLILFAKEGQEKGKVAILKTFPSGHDLTMTIKREPPLGPQVPNPVELKRGQIKDSLELQITNAAQPKITIRDKTAVDRLQHDMPPTHPQSFRWFVDLERPGETFSSPIGVDKDELGPILKFNSGELYTAEDPNASILRVQRGISLDPNSLLKPFGRVALTIGIDFNGVTKAVFKNGADVIFDSDTERVTKYTINITHDASSHPPIVTDANYYYTAVGAGISLLRRIFFLSVSANRLLTERLQDPNITQNRGADFVNALKNAVAELDAKESPFVSPEAACFPAYMSQTELPDS
jgi:hypothetical protein